MKRIGHTRRNFLRRCVSAATGSLAVPAYLSGASPNEKLNLAFVGAGGRGSSLIQGAGQLKNVQLLAFSDVDNTYAGKSYEAFPPVRHYRDYRRMYDDLERQIDAVLVATPDSASITTPATCDSTPASIRWRTWPPSRTRSVLS